MCQNKQFQKIEFRACLSCPHKLHHSCQANDGPVWDKDTLIRRTHAKWFMRQKLLEVARRETVKRVIESQPKRLDPSVIRFLQAAIGSRAIIHGYRSNSLAAVLQRRNKFYLVAVNSCTLTSRGSEPWVVDVTPQELNAAFARPDVIKNVIRLRGGTTKSIRWKKIDSWVREWSHNNSARTI